MEAEASVADLGEPQYFDAEKGLLRSGVFADPVIHRRELDGIFRRSWLFVGPANWLSGRGDFVTTRMGEDEVLVWRGEDDVLRAFINICAAGHQPVWAAPRGRAVELACRCHGWRYNSCGESRGGPRKHLSPISSVDLYKGLVFANHDPRAAPLLECLGEFAWYLDLLLDRHPGGVEAYGGGAVRWVIDANWKAPAQAFAGDTYRDLVAGAAGGRPDGLISPVDQHGGFQVSAGPGAMTILESPAMSPKPSPNGHLGSPRDAFTPTIGTLFPNLSFDWRTPCLHVWHPLGPSRTEVHSLCIVDKGASAPQRDAALRAFQFRSGPAGLRTQDDVLLWRSMTAQAAKTPDLELNLQMGLGRERSANVPGRLGDLFSECNQRAFFSRWRRDLETPTVPPRRWLRAAG
jgi:nitrite reductase/ring-hydroxylating ferredoxin subunit